MGDIVSTIDLKFKLVILVLRNNRVVCNLLE